MWRIFGRLAHDEGKRSINCQRQFSRDTLVGPTLRYRNIAHEVRGLRFWRGRFAILPWRRRVSYDTVVVDWRRGTQVRTVSSSFSSGVLKLPWTFSIVIYEGGSVMSQARSLWRLELARTKWAGGFINWFHPMRIRHLTTGRYLSVNENNELYLVNR